MTSDDPRAFEIMANGSTAGANPKGPPRGETCPECGMTRWEGKQVDGWIEESQARIASLEAQLADALSILPPKAMIERYAAAVADAERLANALRQFVPRQVGNTFYAEVPNMACARAVLAEHRKRQEGHSA